MTEGASASGPGWTGADADAASETAERLVQSPVFVLCTVRSGSTLLRMILNSHSQVRAPHELHLRTLRVQLPKALGQPAMAQIGLEERSLEHLLWDRVLDRELKRSGKRIIVDKTPANAFMWQRLLECWPAARFVFLVRHPAAIVDSLLRARPKLSPARVERSVLEYAHGVEAARTERVGHTLRYEDLVADPMVALTALCRFLGVAWEPTMLEYGRFDHGPLVAGLGDWSDQIQSGRVQDPRQLPDRPLSSPELITLVERWGYAVDPTAG